MDTAHQSDLLPAVFAQVQRGSGLPTPLPGPVPAPYDGSAPIPISVNGTQIGVVFVTVTNGINPNERNVVAVGGASSIAASIRAGRGGTVRRCNSSGIASGARVVGWR